MKNTLALLYAHLRFPASFYENTPALTLHPNGNRRVQFIPPIRKKIDILQSIVYNKAVKKVKKTKQFLDRFFMELPFELVYTPKTLDLNEFPEMRDTKDSPILATAIMEGIDVFITGDTDVLMK